MPGDAHWGGGGSVLAWRREPGAGAGREEDTGIPEAAWKLTQLMMPRSEPPQPARPHISAH